MSAKAPGRSILALGAKAGMGHSAVTIANAVQEQMAKVRAAGFQIEPWIFDPNTAEAPTEEQFTMLMKLVQSRQQWDGVVIGFGVRGEPDLTPVFQRLVNLCVQEIKPSPRFIFPQRPDIVAESILKAF